MTGGRPLYLHEYHPKSQLVVEQHEVLKPKFPAIDVHGHFGSIYSDLWLDEFNSNTRPDLDETVEMLRRNGIKRVVNLDGFWDGFMGMTTDIVLDSLRRHEDFFINFVSVDTDRAKDSGFDSYVRKHLKESREKGFRGVKLFKHVSIMVKGEDGKYIPGRNIPVDDPRLAVIWETAAELDMPVLIHIGDPAAFFEPVDGNNERYEELVSHPEWQYHKPGMYTFQELMEMQKRLLANNPDTTFIVAHVGSHPENLGFVGSCLDMYPNMYIDIAERINELGRQPYTSRKFFHKYQDRILFGTDAYPWGMDYRYPVYFRFLETWDEYFPVYGRWNIYGIGLEDEILEKVYYKNAEKVLKL